MKRLPEWLAGALIGSLVGALLSAGLGQFAWAYQQSQQREERRSVLLRALREEVVMIAQQPADLVPTPLPTADLLLDGQTLDYGRDETLIHVLLRYRTLEIQGALLREFRKQGQDQLDHAKDRQSRQQVLRTLDLLTSLRAVMRKNRAEYVAILKTLLPAPTRTPRH